MIAQREHARTLMYMRTAACLLLCLAGSALAQPNLAPAASPGVRYNRLLIRNAMVIDGAGNPARGPMDIIVEPDRPSTSGR